MCRFHKISFKEAVILFPVRISHSQGFSGNLSILCCLQSIDYVSPRIGLFYEVSLELFSFYVKVSI
jgi:hypothetical protein